MPGNGTNKTTGLVSAYQNGSDDAYTYTYDDNGNITEITQGSTSITYEYDTANRLTRENNGLTNETVTYEYDTWGNILNKKIYAYTTGDLTDLTYTQIDYAYTNTAWGDQLTSYDNVSITYDGMGNPTSYRGYTFGWRGKQLTTASNGTNSLTFEYNEDGLRQKKTVNNVDTDYFYNGSVLIGMQRGTDKLLFSYDAGGSAVSVSFNGTEYYYLRNAQGDVVKLIDASGATAAEYTYDTWGKKVTTTGSLAGTLGTLQPFRYRGYVYDEETGFYYLQSRYYDPTTGRFISADVLLSTGQGVLGNNAYAYCNDNPENMKDPAGNCPGFNPLICPVCRWIALGAGAAAIYLSITGDPDLDIWDNKKRAIAIYYDNGNSDSSLAQQAKLSIYQNNYEQWEPIKVQSYVDLQNAWNSISGEVDDVFFFIHSDDKGFYMNIKNKCETDFTGFKPNDSVHGNVYLLSCHAEGFADRFASQIKKPVIATKSAVNYAIVNSQYAPRRSRWDQFWGVNKWHKHDYK